MQRYDKKRFCYRLPVAKRASGHKITALHPIIRSRRGETEKIGGEISPIPEFEVYSGAAVREKAVA